MRPDVAAGPDTQYQTPSSESEAEADAEFAGSAGGSGADTGFHGGAVLPLGQIGGAGGDVPVFSPPSHRGVEQAEAVLRERGRVEVIAPRVPPSAAPRFCRVGIAPQKKLRPLPESGPEP